MEQCANIFQPRKVYNVDVKTGVTKQVDYISPVGIKDWDKYYVDQIVKLVPKPVSDGSDDYVLEMKIKLEKRDIQETIRTQADGVGLAAMLKKYEDTRDPSVLPQPIHSTDDVVDFTKLPQDNAEYFEYIHGLAAKFESLPVELRKDMSVEQFIQNVTEKQVNDYIASITPKEDKKDE